VAIGNALDVRLAARDPGGAQLSCTVTSRTDTLVLDGRQTMRTYVNGVPVLPTWHFVPTEADYGESTVRFTCSNGHASAFQDMKLNVVASNGQDGAPYFVDPIGLGTTFNPTSASCLVLNVQVRDQDSPQIALGMQVSPALSTATLAPAPGDSKRGTFSLCPPAGQSTSGAIAQYTVTFVADDRTHPATRKRFIVVLDPNATATPQPDDPALFVDPRQPTTDPSVGPTFCADAAEPNNSPTAVAGRLVTTQALSSQGYVQPGLTICPNDLDYFAVSLLAGERIVVDLQFLQRRPSEDLDVHLRRKSLSGDVEDLTPCPPCDATNGQGSSAGEHLDKTAASDGTYYVVVQGYRPADVSNRYDLRIRISR
jgi:hypothetical protein